MSEPALNEEQRDALQEVANLAMGQAATRLATLLDTFIELSVPRVRVVDVCEAAAALRDMTGINEAVTAVRQGFRSDIKGEALVICRSDSIAQLCALVNDPYAGSAYETVSQEELVYDVANVLTGACVSCILDQLGRTPVFSARMERGTVSSSAVKTGSRMWQPKSPMVPPPKSCQSRHLKGA